ncbi:ABC transporter ATP-binding protein [Roseospira visakhapatnamensis]|uniref:Peptide/nickel transport system ATP-binding protein n=1 Tax=Roseospira visakhapatnamensis TaxID=390880 RepID=A0A7W6RAN3_9PROT|nr:oligopeptide/dipeptide ABC transporter ATP-binding protein [Roseospira visakhapatnamensis]MBB4265045.1 peptide/nickel transport system ATP-binding protein [Roseospira visakhapatnamensis]
MSPRDEETVAEGDPVLVRLRGLTKHFDVSPPLLTRLIEGRSRQVLKAVDGLDLDIARGRTTALVGESGCGKSTVARLLVTLYRPTAGDLVFEGTDIGRLTDRRALASARRRMQMIFQDPFASLNPRWRVGRIIAEPLRAHGLLDDPAAIRRRVAELLEHVGLRAADAERFPHEFSGGQRQRISIARGLASSPHFLVCDEPTSALDVSVQAQILNLLRDLQRDLGLTYLIITHDLAVVRFIADTIGVMYLGRLCEVAPADTLFARPRHPYTRLLMETVPDLRHPDRDRRPMAGEVPSPLDPPSGCAFHTRCPLANDRCRRERPALRQDGPGQVACHAAEEGRLSPEGGDAVKGMRP